MNNQRSFIKKCSISTVIAISLMTVQFATANDEDTALNEHRDFATEQALGRLSSSKADQVAKSRELAEKWSVFTEESVETLFRAFYDATEQQRGAVERAQDYEAVRSILLGKSSGSSGALSKTLNKIGDIDKDLVYSPIVPCRVVDTRKIIAGAFSSGTKRGYYVWGFIGPDKAAIASQGGNKFGCVAPRGEPAAVHMVISANPIGPESNNGKGNVQVTPHGTPIPKAVLLKYELGTNITSAATVKTAVLAGKDIDIQVNGQKTHIVIDVMGYYYKVDKNDVDRLPIAYGHISSSGSIDSGTGNYTSKWNATVNLKRYYEIDISGESYFWKDYTTIVTPSSCSDTATKTGSIGGKLLVYFTDVNGTSAGSRKQCAFQFVTYKNK